VKLRYWVLHYFRFLSLHGDWTCADTDTMLWRSRHERAAWAARHPVWGALFMGGLFFLWMLLLPSIREPRLLTGTLREVSIRA
jgi:hypothetical protein